MLHIISSSTVSLAVLQRIDAGDAVLFIDNAVLMLNASGSLAEQLELMIPRSHLFVLTEDLHVRGVEPENLVPGIIGVDYQGFVKLTEANKLIQSW